MEIDDGDFPHHRHGLDKLPVHGHRGSLHHNYDLLHYNLSDNSDRYDYNSNDYDAANNGKFSQLISDSRLIFLDDGDIIDHSHGVHKLPIHSHR